MATSGTANNNGGTIRANGTVNSGVVSSVSTSNADVGVFASTPIDNSWADKAISGGTFAHNHTDPISALITSEIAGVADTSILNPGSKGNVRSINSLVTLRTRRFTTAIRGNHYNRVTNTWDEGYPVVAVDSLSSDTATTPTAAVPGKLNYLSGSVVPTSDNYAAKTVF